MKHIGTHNSRNVVVVFRQVPEEPQNCLIVYNDSLPKELQNTLDSCVKTSMAQNNPSFAVAANALQTTSGQTLLASLHTGGYMRKTPASEVFLTPNDKTRVLLSEVNAMAPVQPMEPTRAPAQAQAPAPLREMATQAAPVSAPQTGALSDEQIANNLRSQAQSLQSEVTRLLKEADELKPLPKRSRGRPPKLETIADGATTEMVTEGTNKGPATMATTKPLTEQPGVGAVPVGGEQIGAGVSSIDGAAPGSGVTPITNTPSSKPVE